MKRLDTLFFLILLATAIPLQAQTPLADPSAVLTRIAEAQRPPQGKRLSYAFRQTKHSPLLAEDAVSHGMLALGPGRSMRWQYTAPTPLTIAIEGDSIYTIHDGRRDNLSGAAGRMTRGLALTMMQLADGGGLTDDKMFDTRLTEDATTYHATMTPKRRDMKRIMQRAELVFDRHTLGIKSVRLVEANDSYTQIDFTKQ